MGEVVYIVEVGCYNDRYLDGVYATLEAAMAGRKCSGPDEAEEGTRGSAVRSGGWKEDNGYWTNGLDWDEAVSIWAEEVVAEAKPTLKFDPNSVLEESET